jgi:hypothetical protein
MKESMPVSVALANSLADLEEACGLLRTPSPPALDAAAAILGRVVAEVAEARRGRPGGASAQTAELHGLQRVVRRARVLLEKASAYHEGWSARVRSLTGGYGPGGEPAAAITRGRLSVEG